MNYYDLWGHAFRLFVNRLLLFVFLTFSSSALLWASLLLDELPDLTAFLCMAGAEPARLVTLKPQTRPVVAESITE